MTLLLEFVDREEERKLFHDMLARREPARVLDIRTGAGTGKTWLLRFLRQEIRGKGLMLGIELTIEGKAIYAKCLNKGLLINCTHGNVLRIMPQLGVTEGEIDQAMKILDKSFAEVASIERKR